MVKKRACKVPCPPAFSHYVLKWQLKTPYTFFAIALIFVVISTIITLGIALGWNMYQQK
jgi:hypothetical protein